MSLQEFDDLIGRMRAACEYAEGLGQHVEAARILFQMNEQLPADPRLAMEDLDDPASAGRFMREHGPGLRSAVSAYRHRLMGLGPTF